MSIRKVLLYPDPRLKESSQPVTEWNEELETLVQDLKDTLEAYQAHGIAAPQVGVPLRVFVVRLENDIRAFINPNVFVEYDCERKMDFEGCLSFPGVYERISRAEEATVTAQDVKQAAFTL